MNKIRQIFSFVVSGVVCGDAMWKGMQILAIVALVIAIGILYKSRSRQVFEFLIEILSRTRQAKLGSFEIEISKELQDISKRLFPGTPY
jgi:hypothetical protein